MSPRHGDLPTSLLEAEQLSPAEELRTGDGRGGKSWPAGRSQGQVSNLESDGGGQGEGQTEFEPKGSPQLGQALG